MGAEGPALTGKPAPARRAGGHRSPWGRQARGLLDAWWPVAPFGVAVAALLFGPAVNIVLDSLRAPDGGPTLQNWADVFTSVLNRRAIGYSVTLGAIVATFCALIGTPLAWCIGRLQVGGRSVAVAALNVAANISATALVFGATATFGAAGLVTLSLRRLLPDFPALDLYGVPGLIVVYVYTHLPLFVLLFLPALGAVGGTLWEAAAVCGASPARFWWRVGIPTLLPFIIAGWSLMFVWAIGAYGLPLALTGTEGGVPLMTLRIGALIESVGRTNRFERAACLSLMLIGLSLVALWGYHMLLRRAARWLS
jgi:putative spermidine/putrescine transport system permease protein